MLLHYRNRAVFRAICNTHVGQSGIGKNELSKLLISFPRIDEQEKIAAIISKVDELTQKSDQVIEQIRKLKKGVMERLLVKGIGHINFKVSKLGKIPQDWLVTKIGDITLEHKQGYYTNQGYVDDGIKLVRISDLFNPRLAYETMPSLTLDEKTFKQFKVDVGDFLIARSGATIGRFGIATKNIPCIFGSYLIRFRFDSEKLNNFFFGILFESRYILGQLTRIKQSTSNININAENIKSLHIALPKLQEQDNIVTVLSSIDRRLEAELNKRRIILKIKKGLMQQLLTGKMRVRI